MCRNTLACREQLLGASWKIWPAKMRMVLLKVSEDDTLKTVFRLQFGPDLLIQRTQNGYRCGHSPQLSSLCLLLLYHKILVFPWTCVAYVNVMGQVCRGREKTDCRWHRAHTPSAASVTECCGNYPFYNKYHRLPSGHKHMPTTTVLHEKL